MATAALLPFGKTATLCAPLPCNRRLPPNCDSWAIRTVFPTKTKMLAATEHWITEAGGGLGESAA